MSDSFTSIEVHEMLRLTEVRANATRSTLAELLITEVNNVAVLNAEGFEKEATDFKEDVIYALRKKCEDLNVQIAPLP